MYAANNGKWNVAMPPARGSRWAAGIKQFESRASAESYLSNLDASGRIPQVAAAKGVL